MRDIGDNGSISFRDDLFHAITFVCVMMAVMATAGLYRKAFRDGLESMLIRLALSVLGGTGVLAGVLYVFPDLFIRRGELLISVIVAFLALVVVRVLFFRGGGHELLKRNILVLGANEGIRQFKRLRRKTDQIAFRLDGFVCVKGEEVEESVNDVLYLDVPLLDYAKKHDIHEIVVATENRGRSELVDDLLDCKMSGIEVVDILTFMERQTGRIRLDMLRPSWLIYSDGFKRGLFHIVGKRLLDIAISSLMLVVSWPVMLGVVVAIWVESGFKGPIFFRQVRVGENWKLFQILKFRSMTQSDIEDSEPRWADVNDERVTRVGRFMRRYRLDELPQLFNVLKGDMSFVGPRPEQPGFVQQLVSSIPYYAERHRVKPGITGWAQVHYPYGASEQDAMEKLQYDLYYVKNCSLFLDFLTILYTVEVVFLGKGAR